MNLPLISIILPTYNGNKKRLSEAIDSVLCQTYKNLELIIINDASTNDIEETILNYGEKDERIVYLKNEINLKLTNTLNKGINHVNGAYIARIDDDDVRTDVDKLQKQIDFLEQNREYGLCGTNIVLENISNHIKTNITMQGNDKQIRSRMLLSTQFSHSSIMIRKEVIDKYGTYDPNYNLMEDHELWLRIGKHYKFHNLQDFTTLYRLNPQGVSLQNRKRQHRLALKLCWKYRNDYPFFIKGILGNIALIILPEKVILLINKINRLFGNPIF